MSDYHRLLGRHGPVIVGPAPCQGCGVAVAYGRGKRRYKNREDDYRLMWRDMPSRRKHECKGDRK